MANTENKDPKKELKKRMVKALFSYSPVNIDELPLKVNDILEVIEETEEGWWKGILDGTVGMFPSNFVVELDGLSEDLNNKLTNELSPTKSSAKVKDINQQEPLNRHENNILIENKQDSKQGAMNSNTSDIIDGSSSSKSISNLPSEKKPVITKQKPSADSSAPRLPPKPVREQALVLYPYESRNEDELTLKEGDIITILSKDIEDKGWWKGELSNRVGVFPDNFVRLIKAEEQKKPERPDKPAAVLSSKSSSKPVVSEKNASESSPKPDKKALKTPPAKPPPPEILKKEPDRPLPPFPTKKPQPPQPVKKPMRSSLGSKVASAQAPTSNILRSSHSGSTPSIIAALSANSENNEENTKSSEPSSEKENQGKDLEFDAIESSGKKLVHLTANRAKAPNRRPPSFIFLKETEKDSNVTKDSRRRSEPLLAEIKTMLPLSDSEKKNSVSSTDMKPKVPPTRPSLPIVRNNSLNKHDSVVSNKAPSTNEESVVKPQENGKKDILSEKAPIITKEVLQPKIPEPSNPPAKPAPPNNIAKLASSISARVPSSVPLKASSNTSTKAPDNSASTTLPTESAAKVSIRVSCNATTKPPSILPSKVPPDSSASVNAEVQGNGDSLKFIMNNMVSKNEYNALLKQVNDLQESLEHLYKLHNKSISGLKEELEVERQLRCSIELELQKLKECQNT